MARQGESYLASYKEKLKLARKMLTTTRDQQKGWKHAIVYEKNMFSREKKSEKPIITHKPVVIFYSMCSPSLLSVFLQHAQYGVCTIKK